MAQRFIGKHVDCGGDVFYFSGPSYGMRKCEKCKADGRYGTRSPDVIESSNKPA
jgi:hypothetical protein